MIRNVKVISSLVFLLSLNRAYCLLLCLDGSLIDDVYGVTCQCENSLYNAIKGECQGACDYFGNNICGVDRYNHGKCIQDEDELMSYTCDCEEGYADPDADGRCTDYDECSNGSLSCDDPDYQICSNQVGYAVCLCKDGYYRSEDGSCMEINSCMNPNDNICHMECDSTGPETYECDCPKGFYMPPGTYDCVVQNSEDKCTQDDCGDHAVCKLDEGVNTCYPALGYEVKADGSVVDIDECKTENYECGANSMCNNEVGFYTCTCNQYMVYDPSFNICKYRTCAAGQALVEGDCVDPCSLDSESCPAGTVCLTDLNGINFCDCGVNCQQMASSEKMNLYWVSFLMPYGKGTSLSNFKYNVTRSMQSIFGSGNAELNDYSYLSSKVKVTMYLSLNEELLFDVTIEEILLQNCQPIDTNSEEKKCVLPAGTIIDEDGIRTGLVELEPICEDHGDDLCPSDIQVCVDFTDDTSVITYTCNCVDGYDKVLSTAGGVSCVDIDECIDEKLCNSTTVCVNTPGTYECIEVRDEEEIEELEEEIRDLQAEIDDLEDNEKKTGVVGGVLGGLLAVAIIVIIALGIYSGKLKKKVAASEHI